MTESRQITVAVTQMACDRNSSSNVDRAESLVRQAATNGANIILLQELFETRYFCKSHDATNFSQASPFEGNRLIARFSSIAKELGVVLPVSFFESSGPVNYNSIAIIDADGSIMGLYRKSHIPDGPGYLEKYYFSPGDSGFKVWHTAYGTIGVGICWDQWFPECARAMALSGAELLLYPTAIGSEPANPEYDSQPHWEAVMRGHAAANMIPVAAANRIGHETCDQGSDVNFYGSSFISNATGQVVCRCSRDQQETVQASFDLDAINQERRAWGLFRDRRPDLYGSLTSLDG